MSIAPPAPTATIMCTGRDGYVCANAIRETAGSGASSADELTKLTELHKSGVLSDDEFATQKAKLLA